MQAGQVGHWGCGWCSAHNRPSFECLCNGARATVRRDCPQPRCEVDNCGKVVTHGEHWYDKMRWWCDDHVPMSGHYEYCPERCRELVRAVTRPEIWAVIELEYAHLRGK